MGPKKKTSKEEKKPKVESNQPDFEDEDAQEEAEDAAVADSQQGHGGTSGDVLDDDREELKLLLGQKAALQRTSDILEKHDVVVQKLVNQAREDLVWEQYMKCDGLPDPVCVRELNTYLSLWKEDDSSEDIDAVLERTQEVLPIMSTMENLIENPDEWEDPASDERRHRSYKNKVQERMKIFNEMKSLQLRKLNRATYNLLLDVSPMVDQESNVLQHFLSSDLVSLGNFYVVLHM